MIDRDHLARMMDGDYAVADRFIAFFKEQVLVQIPQLKTCLLEKDYPLLANTAHIIKTQAGYVRLEELAELAYSVEEAATAAREHDHIEQLTEDLISALQKVLSSMES